MKAKNFTGSIILSTLFITGTALADDVRDDLLYGDRELVASAGEAWVPGSMETDQYTDLLYGDTPVIPTTSSGYERIADDRDITTDIIHSS